MRTMWTVAVGVVLVLITIATMLMWKDPDTVTLYCATDEVDALPIIKEFEERTGIHVRTQFSPEASKTVGLVMLLRSQKATPQADVFWNNEILHTESLAREGFFEPYDSPSAADIPETFRHPDRLYTGFAARARMLIVNTELLPDPKDWPTSMNDLVDPARKGRGSFVKPWTGTTLTHAAALYTVLGDEAARTYLKALHGNEVLFPSGNARLAAAVGGGQSDFGFTDTDDYRKMELQGRPVARVYPDQEEGGLGTLFIPNTVALVKGGPRPDLAKQLIDFLLSREVEERLAKGDAAQIPVRGDVPRPDYVQGPPEVRPMEVDWNDVAAHLDERFEELKAYWE